MEENKKIAAAYIRVSTDDQLEYSPDSQLKVIRQYAKNNGYLLPDDLVFVEDEGRSGRSSKNRPEFLRIIGAAKKQPAAFEVILIWKYSRFARNQEESIVYKNMLRRNGVEVISVSEPLPDGPYGKLIERIIEWMDEFYSINLSGEVRRGMTERAARGKPNAYAPLGYTMADGMYHPDPETAPVVQMIFQDFAAGMSKTRIVQKLNDLGYRSIRGNPFELRTVDYILHNPVYIGFVRWSPDGRAGRDFQREGSIVVKGEHEPLISPELWKAVKAQLAKTGQLYPRSPRQIKSGEYMLHGLVRCAQCGAVMTLSNGGGLLGMQCQRYNKGTCTSHYVRLSRINQAVLDQIRADINGQSMHIRVRQAAQTPQLDAAAIQRGIEKEQLKLQRAKEAFQSGVDTLEEYRENKEAILAAIRRLEEISQPPPPRTVDLAAFRRILSNALPVLEDPAVSEEEKNLLLRTFIEKIEFSRDKDRDEQFRVFYYA